MTLDADDIDAIARRVLELLHDEAPAAPVRLVDARTLAAVLGVKRSWVYAHAQELHAVRLGNGRGRLRFDVEEVRRCLGVNGINGVNRTAKPTGRRTVMAARGKLLPVDPYVG